MFSLSSPAYLCEDQLIVDLYIYINAIGRMDEIEKISPHLAVEILPVFYYQTVEKTRCFEMRQRTRNGKCPNGRLWRFEGRGLRCERARSQEPGARTGNVKREKGKGSRHCAMKFFPDNG